MGRGLRRARVSPAQGGQAEIAWQLANMSEPVQAALRQLPPLGENSAGPLGTRLLASGVLGQHIRAVQNALGTPE